MTITANDRRKTYDGNGAATTFNGPRAFLPAHLSVLFGTNGAFTLVPPSQYTVRGLGLPATTVQFTVPPAAGLKVLILRTVPLDQPTDITNQGAFLPEIHEDAFDYRVMQLQQLSDDSMQNVIDPVTGEFVWDAKGQRIIRVGDAIAPADALNLRGALTLIEQINNGGGTTGITPQFFEWIGDGESTDFPLDGADVLDPLFYDTAMEKTPGAGDYLVTNPEDFQLLPGTPDSPPAIRFPVAPAENVRGFTVLRGYARPWIGQPPIYTVAPEIITNITGDTIIGAELHNTLIVVNSAEPLTLTIRANTGSPSDWKDGQFFSALQLGAGKIRFAIEGAGTLQAPVDFTNETRGVGSVISATCYAPDSDAWVSSGDLLRGVGTPSRVVIELLDRSALSTGDVTVGGKDSYVLPFGVILDAVTDGGAYGSLITAQAAGVPLQLNIRRNGASIFTTRPTFDNGERSTRTAATPAVYAAGGTVLAAGDEIDLDVSQVGTAGARGMRFYLVGQRAG